VARTPRSGLPDGYFHVFSRGVAARGPLYVDDDDRQTFVDLVWHVAERHGWTCHALCVMGTHYHLVVEAGREALSAGVHRLNWQYARYFNVRHRRFGHVFADRFSARVIGSEEYLFDVCAYVVLNPVRAGLCQTTEEWPWSWSSYGLRIG
jgi:putative transposase